jgi:hypothetical protein
MEDAVGEVAGQEPFVKDFTYKDVPCRIRENEMGYLCGYAGVAKGSRLYGVDYDEAPSSLDVVHGGLTFSGPMFDDDGDLWWFGFDCMHVGDAPYDMDACRRVIADGTASREYLDMIAKDVAWDPKKVRAEIRKLVKQLLAEQELSD